MNLDDELESFAGGARKGSPTTGGGGAPPRAAVRTGTAVLPSRQVQHIWFELTRARQWRSVAFVPVDESASTAGLAHQLAQMASLDPRNQLLVINAAGLLQEAFAGVGAPGAGAGPQAHGKYHLLDCSKQNLDETHLGMVEVPKTLAQIARGEGSFNMLMVAAHAPLHSPAAVSICRAVDAVVVCPTLGTTTFADARRTLELVGYEQVVGSICIRRAD